MTLTNLAVIKMTDKMLYMLRNFIERPYDVLPFFSFIGVCSVILVIGLRRRILKHLDENKPN